MVRFFKIVSMTYVLLMFVAASSYAGNIFLQPSEKGQGTSRGGAGSGSKLPDIVVSPSKSGSSSSSKRGIQGGGAKVKSKVKSKIRKEIPEIGSYLSILKAAKGLDPSLLKAGGGREPQTQTELIQLSALNNMTKITSMLEMSNTQKAAWLKSFASRKASRAKAKAKTAITKGVKDKIKGP